MRLNRRQLANPFFRNSAPRSGAKNRIHHSGGKAMARLFCEFHALIDGGVVGNAVEEMQLESPEAKSDKDFRIEPRIGTLEQRANLLIQPDLPAKHAQHQSRGQMAVRGCEFVNVIGPQ